LIQELRVKALEFGQDMQKFFVENDLGTVLGEKAAPNEYGVVELVACPRNDTAVGKQWPSTKLRTPSSSSSVQPMPSTTAVEGQPPLQPPAGGDSVFVVSPCSYFAECTKRQDHVLQRPFSLNLNRSQVWNEQCFIHCMRLVSMGIDTGYQRAVGPVCERSKGAFKAAPIKGYKRMRNKMTSINDHQLEAYPRPGLNMDLNRNCCTFECSQDLLSFIAEMKHHPMFGGHPVRMKNMFHFDEERAEEQFYYRTVMINWLYTPGITYKELAELAKELWSKYHNFECVPGYGHKDPSESWGTWRTQIGVAMAYLTSSEMADKQVQFIVETQLLLHPYLLGRQKMHLLYKVCRAHSPDALHNDFQMNVNPEMRSYEDVQNIALEDMVSFLDTTSDVNAQHESLKGATRLWKAAEQGHVKAVRKILEHPDVDPNKLRPETRTSPLYIASYHGHVDIVKAIAAHPRADVNLGKIDVNVTPLFVAVEHNRELVVEVLLGAKDIVVHALTSTGLSPLREACEQGREHVVQLLVSKEGSGSFTPTSLNLAQRSCRSGLSIAEDRGYDGIARILRAHCAELSGPHKKSKLKSQVMHSDLLDSSQEHRYSTLSNFVFESEAQSCIREAATLQTNCS